MAIKQAEADFIQVCNVYGIWRKKWPDVRLCPHCHKPIFVTKRMEDTGEEKKALVDYLFYTDTNVSHWVECKGKGGHTRLPFSEIQDHQRNFLDDFEMKRFIPCWLFVTLGDGVAPSGRKAWMIPWLEYRIIEERCIAAGMKSLPWIETNRKADKYNMTKAFPLFELEWVSNVGWQFPCEHEMVYRYGVECQNIPYQQD